ncbi:hypothetical protein [Cloacibacillus sp.]|uniref:hypothetical protein n=1 Tax=Cloacibacillus sp. TaxID=2049023 RepID=UPI0025BF731F|nr:hypothetical protein [Cloacibacillus sp.]MCC8057443.1 hypothetical protein [Cloacibacillus sp.]
MSEKKDKPTVPSSYEEVIKSGVYLLSKPYQFEKGAEVFSIPLPFSAATGGDVVRA